MSGVLAAAVAASSTAVAASSASCAGVGRAWGAVETVRVEPFPVMRVYLQTDGTFPNNADYPLLLYQGAWDAGKSRRQGEEALVSNGWTRPWAWGVFTYHHYHSTAWEALLCVDGKAEVQFGGPSGPRLSAGVGDLILIPPGVAHKQLEATPDFTLLGCYPNETPDVDTVRGAPTPAQARSIKACPVPRSDPLFGSSAPWGPGIQALF